MVRRGVGYWLARGYMGINGWKVEGEAPPFKRYVVVGAPHTSGWDLLYTLSVSAILGLNLSWMGKHTLFRGPLGPVLRAVGGIAVDRTAKQDTVRTMVEQFNAAESMALALAPEGTRGQVTAWKTGFYHIAVGANVPIVLGFLDYKRKVGGLGPTFYPTGDLEADLKEIRQFYAPMVGRHPQRFAG